MLAELRSFVPDGVKAEIELQPELAYVVERIGKVLPQKKIWKLFSSNASECGGKIVFPYYRVDKVLELIKDEIPFLNKPRSVEDFNKKYQRLSTKAMKILVWVEVGFEGFENLASSPASTNMTAAGLVLNDSEKAQQITALWKKSYIENMKMFTRFRHEHKITDDCFSQYGLEYLLPKA